MSSFLIGDLVHMLVLIQAKVKFELCSLYYSPFFNPFYSISLLRTLSFLLQSLAPFTPLPLIPIILPNLSTPLPSTRYTFYPFQRPSLLPVLLLTMFYAPPSYQFYSLLYSTPYPLSLLPLHSTPYPLLLPLSSSEVL